MSKQQSTLDFYPDYEATIGVEVHVQLTTKRKIFCWCVNQVTSTPNSNICQICTGQPGVLPALNKKVVEYATMAGLATNCKIAPVSCFSRKHYFYPDLPKGYQTTQGAVPICSQGYIPIRLEDSSSKQIRLNRIHIEEDAGKNIHMATGTESLVNLNRAGTPLLEIVTEPDITNTYELKQYLKALHQIVRYLGICTGNMEDGAFRADTNISVKLKKDSALGTRCELKNINSFKYIVDATEYEIGRQIELITSGRTVIQQTRLWNTKERITIPMRSKEEAADYRYFEDPDLPRIVIDQVWIEKTKKNMPQLPQKHLEQLLKCGISLYEAEILVDNPTISAYFLDARQHTQSSLLVNWVLRDLMGYLKEKKIDVSTCLVTPQKLAYIINMLEDDTINARVAKQLFEEIAQSGKNPQEIVESKGLKQVGSHEELERIVCEIISQNPDIVANYKAGKERLFGFFVGQAMKITHGRGNPKIIQELLKKHLH